MVHLHNGMLHIRENSGADTLCNGMDGSREQFAKGNKPGCEGEIPFRTFFFLLIL